MELADNFRHTIEHPDATITARQDARVVANIKRNQLLLKSLASAVLFCGRQCIASRGDNEKIDASGNPGSVVKAFGHSRCCVEVSLAGTCNAECHLYFTKNSK